MANFLISLDNTLKFEGGYVNDPADPGGETYKGISKNNWANWNGWEFVDKKDFEEADKYVQIFYYINFWEPLELESVEQSVANNVFDIAVNMGVKKAIVCFQTAINILLPSGKIDVDGVMGKETLEAYKKVEMFVPSVFIFVLKNLRIMEYFKIVEKNSNLKKYFFGWIKRGLSA